MHHIKKIRNTTDTQVKKYKQELDAIGIKHDHKSAHVQVPNSATGGFEYFKWDWMTSTTGSHSEIVQIFKDVVRTLKEKNNSVQYNSSVSNLSASAKSALEATIQSSNITVPTQDTNKVISEILVGMQTWIDTKSHIPMDLKQKFLGLGFENLNIFIESAYKQFNNQWVVKEFIDNAFIPHREEINKYLTDSGCASAEELIQKYVALRLKALDINGDKAQKDINSTAQQPITFEEDSDDDIEVTLTSSEKYKVSEFIRLLKEQEFEELEYYYNELSSDDKKLVQKELVVVLAHMFCKKQVNFKDAKEIAQKANEIMPEFEADYNSLRSFSDAQLHEKEMEISGVSHLHGCDYHV